MSQASPSLGRVGLAELLFPPRCPVCRRCGEAPCATCRERLGWLGPTPPPLGLESLVVLFSYQGPGRELVARTKYRGDRSALGWMAAALAARCRDLEVDAVTWVPTTSFRQHQRGFDHGELLARRVSRHLAVPAARLLVSRATAPQTGRSRAERLVGPRLAPRGPVPARVVVVDDVVTTGASLVAAASALARGGAVAVHAAVVARTPGNLAPSGVPSRRAAT